MYTLQHNSRPSYQDCWHTDSVD